MSTVRIEYTDDKGFTTVRILPEVSWFYREEIIKLSDEQIDEMSETKQQARFCKRVKNRLIELNDKKVEVSCLVH